MSGEGLLSWTRGVTFRFGSSQSTAKLTGATWCLNLNMDNGELPEQRREKLRIGCLLR